MKGNTLHTQLMIYLWQRRCVSPLILNCEVFLWCRPLLPLRVHCFDPGGEMDYPSSSYAWVYQWNLPKIAAGGRKLTMKPQQAIRGLSLLSGRPSLALTLYLSLAILIKIVGAFYIVLSGVWHSCMFEPWYWKMNLKGHNIVFSVLT